mgnify:CR=1 FL=1
MRNVIIIAVAIIIFSICYFLTMLVKLQIYKHKCKHEEKIKIIEKEKNLL